jgi:hypothetical protein
MKNERVKKAVLKIGKEHREEIARLQREIQLRDDELKILRGRQADKRESDEFWKDIIYKDGKINEEQVMKELADFYFVIQEVPKVYCHVTGGMLSYVTYPAQTIISVADDQQARDFRAWFQDHMKEKCEPCKAFLLNSLKKARRQNTKIHVIIKWLLGEFGDFPVRQEGEGAYYWRDELRKRLEKLEGNNGDK